MNEKRTSMIAICLAAVLAVSPAVSFAQGTTTFSGEAVALKANALEVSLALADTGPLPSSGKFEHGGCAASRYRPLAANGGGRRG